MCVVTLTYACTLLMEARPLHVDDSPSETD